MPPDPPAGFIPSSEACERLGISDRTLRRRVQAGTIEGEYVPRPQGSVLYVRLPQDAAAEAALDAAQAADPGPTDPPDTAGHTAVVLAFLERLGAQEAALLAATERAVKAEVERDAARQAAQAAVRERADLAERLRLAEERLATRKWYDPRTW